MDWLDEYSYGEMLNTSCLIGNLFLRSWSCRVWCAFYLNRCVSVAITLGTVSHWSLHLTVERSELLLTFPQHTLEQIFTLWETYTNQETKGMLGAKWCFLLLMLIAALKAFYPAPAWNANVVDISTWNGRILFGLFGSLALKLFWRRDKANDGSVDKQARLTGRSCALRHRSEGGFFYRLSVKLRKIFIRKGFMEHKAI